MTQEIQKTKEFDVKDGQLIQTDGTVSDKMMQAIDYYCELNHLPRHGITILGGKIYVNATGLARKLEDHKQIVEVGRVKRKTIEVIQRADAKTGMRAGYLAIIELYDTPEREKARLDLVMKCVENKYESPQILKIVEDMGFSAPIFKREGWCSPESVKMGTLKNIDIINMMAETRAVNGATRMVVGSGLTSLEEMPDYEPENTIEGEVVPEKNVTPPEKPKEQGFEGASATSPDSLGKVLAQEAINIHKKKPGRPTKKETAEKKADESLKSNSVTMVDPTDLKIPIKAFESRDEAWKMVQYWLKMVASKEKVEPKVAGEEIGQFFGIVAEGKKWSELLKDELEKIVNYLQIRFQFDKDEAERGILE